jgi:hypothetical protein
MRAAVAQAAVRPALALLLWMSAAAGFAASLDAKASAPGAAGKPGASPAPAAASKPSAAAAAPIEFIGTLESGKTYVAEVFFDNNALHIWRPAKDVQVPRQNAWIIDWMNLAKFPALKTAATRSRPQRFQFKVESVDVSSGSPALPWTTVYHCAVLAVEPASGTPAPPARGK